MGPGTGASSSSSSSSSSYSFTSHAGRERALEVLMDNDPWGSYYHASRVVEETIPQSYAGRPNHISKAALVDEALSLSKHAIDTAEKYDQTYPEPVKIATQEVDALTRERILNHFNRTVASDVGEIDETSSRTSASGVKTSSNKTTISSAALISKLRQIFEEPQVQKAKESIGSDSEHFDLKELLKLVAIHSSTTNLTYQQQIESSIAQLCKKSPYHLYEDKQPVDEDYIRFLLSIILNLIVPPADLSGHKSDSAETSEPAPVFFQVASLLTLLPAEKDDADYLMDSETLDYFAKSVSVSEERLEIKKARMLQRLQTPSVGVNTGTGDEDGRDNQDELTQMDDGIIHDNEASSGDPLEEAFERFVTSVANAPSETAENPFESLERLVSTMSRVEEAAAAAAAGDEQPSHLSVDSFNYPGLSQRGDSSSSSSSSSSESSYDSSEFSSDVGAGGDGNEIEPGGEGESEEDDHGRALSVFQEGSTNTATSITADMESPFLLGAGQEQGEDITIDGPGPETPVSVNGTDDNTQSQENAPDDAGRPSQTDTSTDEHDLPPIPVAPTTYPFWIFDKATTKEIYDPASSSRFGLLPVTQVLMHILQHASLMMARRRASDVSAAPGMEPDYETMPGGTGFTLFQSTPQAVGDDGKTGRTRDNRTLQLLASCIVLIDVQKNATVKHLQDAIARANRVAESSGSVAGMGTISSGEEDDPAMALALNYVEDGVSLSSASLENKGMRRKAAAAAYDAAALRKSLERQVDTLRGKMRLYCRCLVLSLRMFRVYLQSRARRSAGHCDGKLPSTEHLLEFSSCLPGNLQQKLSSLFSELLSRSGHSLYRMLLGDVGEKLTCDLYREGVKTWGECVPLIFPSSQSICHLLQDLLSSVAKHRDEDLVGDQEYKPIDDITSLPLRDGEIFSHKLQILCVRMRVKDLLDVFVRPHLPFLATSEANTYSHLLRDGSRQDRPRGSLVMSHLASSIPNLVEGRREAAQLYLALCHEMHSRVLLMGGLHTATKTEADEAATPTHRSKTVPVGDTVRISSKPSSQLEFDSTKCADSIAILSDSSTSGNGSSVHQRASKVWGTVLSTRYFTPKSGIHRWAVRLDKCERGHVFIGLATAQGSMRTYVGGDKFGWGMIGTQALWHDRRKIRGDYGATLRSGATVVVTLDTDAGTVSFGLWKDSGNGSNPSVDPVGHGGLGSRKQDFLCGSMEDWGTAFEGLPLDSRLYPAVGLYQRDDRVTLLSVVEGGSGVAGIGPNSVEAGDCFYPVEVTDTEHDVLRDRVRKHNAELSVDGMIHVAQVLEDAATSLKEEQDHFLVSSVLPSLAATICILPPTVPVLSTKHAIVLMPHIRRCLETCSRFLANKGYVPSIFDGNIAVGKWVIRATGNQGVEEYFVDMSEAGGCESFLGVGRGTVGKSKNGHVSIHGTVRGLSVNFVEEWSDSKVEVRPKSKQQSASSCIVTAKMSSDGKRFEGTYRNVQYGTSGHIAGILTTSNAPEEVIGSSFDEKKLARSVGKCHVLLSMAQAHLSSIASSSTDFDRMNLFFPQTSSADVGKRTSSLGHLVDSIVLSNCSLSGADFSLTDAIELMRATYLPDSSAKLCGLGVDSLLDSGCRADYLLHSGRPKDCDAQVKVDSYDNIVVGSCRGQGSLRPLCPDKYTQARKQIVASILHLSGESTRVDEQETDNGPDSVLLAIWQAGFRILEDGVRKALSQKSANVSRNDCAKSLCHRYSETAKTLMNLDVGHCQDAKDVIKFASVAFDTIQCDSDRAFLGRKLRLSTCRAALKLFSLDEISTISMMFKTTWMASCEAIAVTLPKQLGRRSAVATRDVRRHQHFVPDLDGTYLAELSGANIAVKSLLRTSVLSILRQLSASLGHIVGGLADGSYAPSKAPVISLLLAVLPVFACQTGDDEFQEFWSSNDLVHLLPNLLGVYRREFAASCASSNDMTQVEVSGEVHLLCLRDQYRTILRCCGAVAHVVLYQTSVVSSRRSDLQVTKFVSALLEELGRLFECVEQDNATVARGASRLSAEDDVRAWKNVLLEEGSAPKQGSSKSRKSTTSCLEYIRMYGLQVRGPSGKAGGQTTVDQLAPGTFMTNTLHEMLTQGLHALCAMFRSELVLQEVAGSTKWLEMLLHATGLAIKVHSTTGEVSNAAIRDNRDGVLPVRFRVRLLRLLYPLLQHAPRNDRIAEALFDLAGMTSPLLSRSVIDGEKGLSTACVSLLRQLHAPGSKWRSCINSVIETVTGPLSKTSRVDSKRIGVLSFFSGSLGVVSRGSYVILKSPNAAALSSDQSSSSKSHSSSANGSSGASGAGGSPHHLVGNGTESVVAGLCSRESSAGIVSSLDMKNGLCEVILLPRDLNAEHESSEEATLPTLKKRQSSGRQALTVRALRTPLSDTYAAQEVPLSLDDSLDVDHILQGLLKNSLDSILLSMKNYPDNVVVTTEGDQGTDDAWSGKDVSGDATRDTGEAGHEGATTDTKQLGATVIASDILVIRTCIMLMSDEKILDNFVRKDSSWRRLQGLLEVAWPPEFEDSAIANILKQLRPKSLAYLSAHEARLEYLLSLKKNVQIRAKLLKDRPDDDFLTPTETRQTSPAAEANVPSKENESNNSGVGGHEGGKSRSGSNFGSRDAPQPSRGSTSVEMDSKRGDDDDSDMSNTAAAHLREAAIAQMAELGLPRSWSELALRRVGGLNIEAAVTFCLECGGEMERLIAEERERMMQREASDSSAGRRRMTRDSGPTNQLLQQLVEMGFPQRWCVEALAVTGNNLDEALTWILNNGERLSEEDEVIGADGDDDEDDDDDDEEDGTEQAKESEDEENDMKLSGATVDEASDEEQRGWRGSITPVRFISGRSLIDPVTLEISGLPNGGFSSVGTKGVLLTSGKWYYEATLLSAGCLQIGWADGSFSGHCHADRGDGCGDGPSSWAYDGWRRYRWHSTATEWGCRWKEGDVVGCMVDMDERVVSFTLNGEGESIGMGVAFSGEGFRPCGGVYACVSFNRREKLKLVLGGKGSAPFKYKPPEGYLGVGEAVLEAAEDLDRLLMKEQILDERKDNGGKKAYLCDFSDGEHGHELMAWGHRYYGADASVHLGAGSPKHGSSNAKGNSSTDLLESPDVYITRRLNKVWCEQSEDSESQASIANTKGKMLRGFDLVEKEITHEIFNEYLAVVILLSRKLILHITVGMGSEFDSACFAGGGVDASFESLRKFWKVVEVCASLSSAGWAGEAGAMAIAAESLGLGISSNDHSSSRISGDKHGLVSAFDLDPGLVLPVSGSNLLLSSVRHGQVSQMNLQDFMAAAELPLSSGGGGGVTAFLKESLASALSRSDAFRSILVASVRRSIRVLSVVEYDGEEIQQKSTEDLEDVSTSNAKSEAKSPSENIVRDQPDARLVAFVSGLLLSGSISKTSKGEIAEAWGIGLLSASLPWRMVCALTVSGIVRSEPSVVLNLVNHSRTLSRLLSRLPSTVARRVWAERAAVPVCSRFVQAMIELLTSIKHAIQVSPRLPTEFMNSWRSFDVDAATPLPLETSLSKPSSNDASKGWQAAEGLVVNDSSWTVWIGQVVYEQVSWKVPLPSKVPALMDGGEGPPFLDVGCTVMRGEDWDKDGSGASCSNDDGKEKYDEEKLAREKEKRRAKEAEKEGGGDLNGHDAGTSGDEQAHSKDTNTSDPKKKKKLPSPKLPVGTVTAIEAWNGMPALGRRVRWELTGVEGVYRFGGDGGRFDICHVDVNKKSTRVKKRHPLPETAEQCASRHGFGRQKAFNVVLRVQNHACLERGATLGVLEWPDFGAAILVKLRSNVDGSIIVKEERLLFGSKDSGWEIRFGQPSFIPGSEYRLLIATKSTSELLETLEGETSFAVEAIRNPNNGQKMVVRSKMIMTRGKYPSIGKQGSVLPPFCFDSEYHAGSLSLSRDRRTVSCDASEGRGTAFASIGFTKGVHYWEVKLEHADIGSVFVGVAEKPNGSGSGSSFGFDSPLRLNRWHGWGFANFRATYTSGAERVYGAHCHTGDTVGVLLDCDAGRVSFFFDGLKYGEHILNDLGCAFEHLSPFGFNVDGCGSGGAGQGAPNGFEGGRGGRYPSQGAVRPRALFPVVGLRNHGDRVTLSRKWSTSFGVDGVQTVRNILAFDEMLSLYNPETTILDDVPDWICSEVGSELSRWSAASSHQCVTRGSGPYRSIWHSLDVLLDTTPVACASASTMLGLNTALLAGDRVRLTRSAGRILELAEEAVILGACGGKLFYRIVSQKSEGGSLSEGGGRAWCIDESEVVDGLPIISSPKGLSVPLPKLAKFKCPAPHGLKVVHSSGAVIRSDLEIFDGSNSLGLLPEGSILASDQVLERRVNSCGVVRYRIVHESGEGWISARIRGGKEEEIVVDLESSQASTNIAEEDIVKGWFDEWKRSGGKETQKSNTLDLSSSECKSALLRGTISGMSALQSDGLIAKAVNMLSNFSETGDSLDLSFDEVVDALSNSFNVSMKSNAPVKNINPASHEAVVEVLSEVADADVDVQALVVRVAFLRALNRRAKLALPWMSLRPFQEGSAILGGLAGHGTSVVRSGRSRLQQDDWVTLPSTGLRMRKLRSLFFASMKREFIQSIAEVTTTPTPLSHDEYELPREIRTVRINRLKAGRAMMSNDTAAKRKHSVFAQLQNETKSWGGAALRRGYVAKGHGGQKRAFKVKLIGEGVNDYSGPYREVFTDATGETMQLDDNGNGVLGVLDASPNNKAGVGEDRETFMFSLNGKDLNASVTDFPARLRDIRKSFEILTLQRDEASREVEDALVFLGRMVGTAYRHGIAVDLPLPIRSVWMALTEELCSSKDQLEELDYLAGNLNRDHDISPLMLWQQRMLNSFTEGLSSVLPVELFPILTGEELRSTICGNPEVDVDLLKAVVELEGYKKDDKVIDFFWETLRDMSNNDRMKFLQFVWARNRLPLRASDFEAPFKILRDSVNDGEKADEAFPSASTCFFSLTLPNYSSLEILRKKLLFAISNVTTMETDFLTSSAEVAEGYQAF